MNADDLAVKLYAELRKHPHDAREFIRGMLEQMSDAELAEIIGAANEGVMKVGDTVVLKGKKQQAKIVAMLPDVKGGVVLDKRLEDFKYWNVKDLKLVRRESSATGSQR